MGMPQGSAGGNRGLIFRCITLCLVLALASGATAGCDRTDAAGRPGGPGGAPPPAVTVARPVERAVIDWDEYTGRLEAAEAVNVRARVSGFIDSAEFIEGSVVKAGDPLFVIDPRPFQAEVDRAAAEVARAQAQVQQTSEEFARLERIRSGGSATEREFLNARYNKAAADAALASARAALESANLNLRFTRVTAPIGGRVGRKLVTPGNLITGGGTGGPATLLTTIASLDPIYCYFDADERAVLKYQRLSREHKRQSARDARMNVSLSLADETGFPHEGYIDFINNRLDSATGTLQARASIRNPDGFFTPGLFARLRIPGSAPYRAVQVADEAIGADQSQRFVLVLGPNDVVQYRPVTVGGLFEGLRVVEGVRPTDRVVVNGLQRARPGMKVTPTEAPMPVRATGPAATGPASAPATAPTSAPAATAPTPQEAGAR